MSFNAIVQASIDPDLRARVAVAVARQDISPAGPEAWVNANMLAVASNKAIYEPYAYAIETQPFHSRRGFDPSIIADAAITDAVAYQHQKNQEA